MVDHQGYRRKFGVLGPSTNTIVQPDFDDMRPRGVTNHYSRIYTPNANAVSNESFRAGAETIASNVLDAVRSVMTCAPDYLVMGMSAVTFYGGAEGAQKWRENIEREAGLQLDPALTAEVPIDTADAAEPVIERLLVSGPPCTALFAGNDRYALATYRVLRRLGRKAGIDLSALPDSMPVETLDWTNPAIPPLAGPDASGNLPITGPGFGTTVDQAIIDKYGVAV